MAVMAVKMYGCCSLISAGGLNDLSPENVTGDYPGFRPTAFTVKMTDLAGEAPYTAVDLNGGMDAVRYPVSHLSLKAVGPTNTRQRSWCCA